MFGHAVNIAEVEKPEGRGELMHSRESACVQSVARPVKVA